jgi:hypothetical protein
VSTAGGFQPRWRGEGRELFYVTADGDVMAVPLALARTRRPARRCDCFANDSAPTSKNRWPSRVTA